MFDNSELKRRLKADKKAKEKAEKSAAVAAAAAVPATTANSEPSLSSKESEDIDPNVSCLTVSFVWVVPNAFVDRLRFFPRTVVLRPISQGIELDSDPSVE